MNSSNQTVCIDPVEIDEHAVRLSLLGGFELRLGGRLATIPPSSERVLAFLALRKQRVSRSLVAGTLWPEASEEKAKGSLRSALCRLHKVADGVIDASTSALGLAENVHVDVHEFFDLTSRSTSDILESATRASWRDLSAELLPGWYDDWVLVEAERWRQVRLLELESLGRRFLEAGHPSEALLVALSARDVDPLRESANALLIEAQLRQGNRSEAIRQYDLYRKILAEELGLEPTPEFYRWAEQLQLFDHSR